MQKVAIGVFETKARVPQDCPEKRFVCHYDVFNVFQKLVDKCTRFMTGKVFCKFSRNDPPLAACIQIGTMRFILQHGQAMNSMHVVIAFDKIIPQVRAVWLHDHVQKVGIQGIRGESMPNL